MKRAFRWFCGSVLFLALAVTGGALIPSPLMPANASADTAGLRRILVLSGPIHTDIAIPLDDDVRTEFGFLRDAGIALLHPDARWLIFGWGGRSFYLETPTWSELKPLPVLRALSVDLSVLHVDVAGPFVEPQDAITSFDIDDDGFRRLTEYISESFRREGGETVLIPDISYGPNDRLFEANGYFNALLGCNTWTAGALRSSGLRTGIWNPLPETLDFSLRLYN
ncbi:TIGR02117 family protein [Sinorhizobium medicae]|nr:TIGR02117 family protein [Sinorhizobium medicae]